MRITKRKQKLFVIAIGLGLLTPLLYLLISKSRHEPALEFDQAVLPSPEGLKELEAFARIPSGVYLATTEWRDPVSLLPIPMSYAQAVATCEDLSQRFEGEFRLPSEAEWETAAQAGIQSHEFPWGHGNPISHAAFDQTTASPAKSFGANLLQFYDLGGNLAEWMLHDEANESRNPIAKGGSWAERDPKFLEITHKMRFPSGYEGLDVGFRPVWIPATNVTN